MTVVSESYIKLNHQASESGQELRSTQAGNDLTSLIMRRKRSAGVFLWLMAISPKNTRTLQVTMCFHSKYSSCKVRTAHEHLNTYSKIRMEVDNHIHVEIGDFVVRCWSGPFNWPPQNFHQQGRRRANTRSQQRYHLEGVLDSLFSRIKAGVADKLNTHNCTHPCTNTIKRYCNSFGCISFKKDKNLQLKLLIFSFWELFFVVLVTGRKSKGPSGRECAI